jgi:hypothetical protein
MTQPVSDWRMPGLLVQPMRAEIDQRVRQLLATLTATKERTAP